MDKKSNSFVFYEDFYKVGKMITEPEERIQFYESIFERGLYGKALESTNKEETMAFFFVESLMSANERRRENGKKGGRPTKTIQTEHTTVETERTIE